jgi:putative Mg2+ transporter-C (MgtC) family protein
VEIVDFGAWALDSIWARRDEALRLVLACALGGWIGLEREASGKPAGFRTNLIICLGAALVTEISIAVSHQAAATGGQVLVSDPGRIAAQVVSGIGFLGAGTIIQSRGSVQGLTTAATLWVVAMIGIGVGAQAYVEVVVATLLVIMALRVLGRVDDHLFPGLVGVRTIEVVLRPRPGAVQRTTDLVKSLGGVVRSFDVERSLDHVTLTMRVTNVRGGRAALVEALMEQDEVENVALR